MLEGAGWQIQDLNDLNLGAALGVAVSEFRMSDGAADYGLFVDRKMVGVVEAKPAGASLILVPSQISAIGFAALIFK